MNCCSGSSTCKTRRHWSQSVDSADKKIPRKALSGRVATTEKAQDRAVYTQRRGAARSGYPQVAKGRNPSDYLGLLTLSGHLRTLAALPKVRPGFGWLMIQVPSHETHISAQQNKARTHSRFSCPHGHQGRATRSQAPSCKRSHAVDAVAHSALVTTTSNNSGLTTSPGNRFRKTNRLLDAAAFGRVFQEATRSRDKFFTVLYRRNEESIPRLGLAISKKHCRRATIRNRIKRTIRESFRQNQEALTSLDIVVINQPAAASADNRQIVDSLENHWRRCQKAKRTPQES